MQTDCFTVEMGAATGVLPVAIDVREGTSVAWGGDGPPHTAGLLKHEARGKLHVARRSNGGDRPEAVPVARLGRQVRGGPIGQAGDVQGRIDIVELRVVERVERVQAQFEAGALLDPDLFFERDIPAVDRSAVEEVASRFQSQAAEARRGERRDIELAIRVAAAA